MLLLHWLLHLHGSWSSDFRRVCRSSRFHRWLLARSPGPNYRSLITQERLTRSYVPEHKARRASSSPFSFSCRPLIPVKLPWAIRQAK